MNVIDRISIKDVITNIKETRAISADAAGVVFQDEDKNLEQMHDGIYNLIPTKEDNTKGFGTVGPVDVAESGDAASDQAVLGSDSRLHKITIIEEDDNPGEGSELENGTFLIVLVTPDESYLTNFTIPDKSIETFNIIGGE